MKKPIDISILRGPQFYSFSDCYLDTVERRLFKKNKRLEVTPRALEVLQVLVENAGEVVSKDELLDQIWGESFVEEGNLPVQISTLRSALGASKDEPYIVTESGIGYKFVSRVKMVNDDEWADIIENELSRRKDGKQQFTSIAVMPLLNENGDGEIEYLADGITESLINSLSRVPDLRVIARNTVFQFKGKEINIKKLGRRLRVATILTGRVRIVRENLVIGVELTKVSDGSQIWGTQTNEAFDDIFEVQDKISDAIGDELRLKISEPRKATNQARKSRDAEAYKLMLKGKFFARKGGAGYIKKAIECLQLSISLEPTFGDTYLALADCYIRQVAYDVIPREEALTYTERMIEKAESLSGSLGQILYLKAQVKTSLKWELMEAKTLFEKSLRIEPNSESCNFSMAMFHSNVGNIPESLYFAQKLLKIDPISVHNQRNVSRIYYKGSLHEEALMLLHETLEYEPHNYESLVLIAANLTELGRFDEAYKFMDEAASIHEHLEVTSLRGYTYAKSKDLKNAHKVLDFLENDLDVKCPPTYRGVIYSEIGELDSAFKCIDDGMAIHQMDIMSIKVDPRFSKLRTDKRFAQVLEKIGLDSFGKP